MTPDGLLNEDSSKKDSKISRIIQSNYVNMVSYSILRSLTAGSDLILIDSPLGC